MKTLTPQILAMYLGCELITPNPLLTVLSGIVTKDSQLVGSAVKVQAYDDVNEVVNWFRISEVKQQLQDKNQQP